MKTTTSIRALLFGKLSIFFVLFLLSGPLNALSQSQVGFESDVIEWAGYGPNAAFVVIDFDADPDLSAEFVFGVNFTSDTITGEDALRILATQSNLTVTSQTSAFGVFVTGFEYTHDALTYAVNGEFSPEDWSYYIGSDAGTSWSLSGAGASDRILNPNSIDGWAFGQFAESVPNGPRVTPPASLSIAKDVIAVVGSGNRHAFVVFDFSASTTDSAEFVFQVNFSESSISGADALILLDTLSDVTITSTVFPWGLSVSAIQVDFEGQTYQGTAAWPQEIWTYYLSRDFGANWLEAPVGASGRTLHHKDTDGWVYALFGTSTPNGPRLFLPPPTATRFWEQYQ